MKHYSYIITGLECANCAARVEKALNEEEDFKNVKVNFSSSKISFDTALEDHFKKINNLLKEIEPGSKIIKEESEKKDYHFGILILATILGILGFTFTFKFHEILIYLSIILLLYKPFTHACILLIKRHTIDENLLITISCIGALFVDSAMEGVMVAALYMLGKILEEKAVNKTRKGVSDLLTIKQDYANLKKGKNYQKVSVYDINIDDVICIKKGEKVPVDGILLSNNAKFDTSSLTGEAEPVDLSENQEVLSGYINLGEVVLMKVTSKYEDSTVFQILELVEKASDKKANIETTVSKLSKIYTPTVLVLAILVAILLPLFTDINYQTSIYRGLTFLVISCPCAIAISVPLSYFTGIGVASRSGILVKGSNYLDNLSKTKKIIFDKTGTLTTGTFKVSKIEILDKKYNQKELIELIRKGESLSNHPIAKSIVSLSTQKINTKDVKNYKEIEASGISFEVNDLKIKIGNQNLCDNCHEEASIHVNINGKHVASIFLDDGIKPNAKEVISLIKKQGIKTYMFTGDRESVAKEISNRLELDGYKAKMLPTDKYKEYEKLENNEIAIFVGDGINDSPVLKRSSIGISMGGIGSDAAIEASDIVIMNDDLMKIPYGINISKYTNLIIKENLIFAISVKVAILLLSIFGLSTMWFAVFADTGVTVLAILNTLRIILKFKKQK